MRTEWFNGVATAVARGGLTGMSSRRGFLKAGAGVTGGLVLGFFLPTGNRLAQAAPPPPRRRTRSCAWRPTIPSQ
jgi:isoquinoline 1-oxidoreductase subunit beta